MTTKTDLLDALKALSWPDLGLEGEPDQISTFIGVGQARWRDIVGVLRVPIGHLIGAASGSERTLRALEPVAAEVDHLLDEIAQDTGVRLPPELFARAAREATSLIPHLLGTLALAGFLVVAAFAEMIKEEYGDDIEWFLFGAPREAAAYRALHEDADVRHFLRVFGNGGELGLSEHLAGYEFPVEELETEVRSTDLLDKTFPELHQWREETVRAAYTVAEYRAREKREDSRAQAIACLSAAELLQFARAADRPRGFAVGDEVTYRRLENARKRARRHVERLQRNAQN